MFGGRKEGGVRERNEAMEIRREELLAALGMYVVLLKVNIVATLKIKDLTIIVAEFKF